MAKEWTDDEVTQEIRDAVAIVREDRLETFIRSRFSPANDEGTNPPTPPASNGDPNPTPKRKSLFWGTEE